MVCLPQTCPALSAADLWHVMYLCVLCAHAAKPAGGNYTITAPGTYTLRRGTLSQLPEAAPNPVMVVSDLDGTMVGDDAATAAFRDWWENEALLRGGVLVYNTGR